jgi:hypothetical protein
MLIGSIRDIVFGEVVNKGKGPIINGLINHTHVISVQYTMNKAVDLPVCHQLRSFLNNDFIHLFVWIALIFVNVWVAVF